MTRGSRLFSRPGVVTRVTPFAAAAVASALTLGIPGKQSEPRLWIVGLAMLLGAVAMAMLVPWSRLPALVELAPVLTFLGAVAVLRHGEGGAGSGLAPLVVLPIVFVALYGTRRQALVTLVASALVFAVPTLVLDDILYPSTEWRRTIVWLIAGATATRAIQSLVREIADRSGALEALGAASRSLLQSEDPHEEVCEAACRAAGGDFAILMAARDGVIVPVAAAGTSLPDDIRISPDHPTSGTARAFISRSTVFAPDARSRLISEQFTDATGVASAVFEPVLVASNPIAVLMVGYKTPVSSLPDHIQRAITILAADAAQAIERERLLARLEAAARHDPLTGVANRRLLQEFLDREFARASRSNLRLSIAMIDLDHFKVYNDLHGHVAGDTLLSSAATAWTSQLRPTDLLARYGGEEFLAVLVDADAGTALSIAERLRVSTPHAATCSIGLATWNGIEPATELISRADTALYLAKNSGRDRVMVD